MVFIIIILYLLCYVCEGRLVYIIVVGFGIFFSCDKILVSEYLY